MWGAKDTLRKGICPRLGQGTCWGQVPGGQTLSWMWPCMQEIDRGVLWGPTSVGSGRRQDQAEGKLGGDISTMKISAQPTRSPELGQGWRGGWLSCLSQSSSSAGRPEETANNSTLRGRGTVLQSCGGHVIVHTEASHSVTILGRQVWSKLKSKLRAGFSPCKRRGREWENRMFKSLKMSENMVIPSWPTSSLPMSMHTSSFCLWWQVTGKPSCHSGWLAIAEFLHSRKLQVVIKFTLRFFLNQVSCL